MHEETERQIQYNTERDRGRERERMESFQLVERIVLRIGFKEFVVVTHKN